jgi:KDO2-lipid IV(A) lauroyltransferase
VYFEPPLETVDDEANDEIIRIITQRHVRALERWVRQYPEQWFWTHRRWKTRPEMTQNKRQQHKS